MHSQLSNYGLVTFDNGADNAANHGDMFSGRPNPTWVVDADQARVLLQDIAQNQSAIGDVSAGYRGLGYRGMIVEALIDNVASKLDLPAKFRVAHTPNAKGLEFADRVFSAMRQVQVWDPGTSAARIARGNERSRRSRSPDAQPVIRRPSWPVPT